MLTQSTYTFISQRNTQLGKNNTLIWSSIPTSYFSYLLLPEIQTLKLLRDVQQHNLESVGKRGQRI